MSRRRTIAGKRALVTGASGGIGRAIAVELAQRGACCVLLARRCDPLHETAELVRGAGAKCVEVVGDVTQPADRQRAIDAAADGLGGLDLLVNNAGVGAHGRWLDAPADRLRHLMEVNFFAVAQLTREAMPLLQQGLDPVVVNIGSILGWRGVPQDAEYCSSKFALRGWGEAIRPELALRGVALLDVSPASTESGFLQNLVAGRGEAPWGKQRGTTAEFVAQQVVHAVACRKHHLAAGWRAKAFLALNRYAPWLLERKLSQYG
ncbi:Putative oxidoreductase SadH [Pirellulimonas nuda]|uniref:Oxidoreductase SadH n=1 Tax=Pirellulimonas nuda TaxID=2528009 RepID=A0A518DGI8_9BACT|nr:SDR family NAD(P)-dependent oxidoreductase [Pirellulimonas nuda]QDU90588.1 Putative oxidoreductase SadH [Pirellulimonas nuda]